MKAKNFAVSIQYGSSFHYFVGYADTREKALEIAKKQKPKIRKKGPRPTVRIWLMFDKREV